jgi:pimeloyl-ACP methyl ester carboxylesterase
MRLRAIALAAIRRWSPLALVALGALVACGPAVAREVASEPVVFKVQNTNGSMLPCASDGTAYQLKGDLVGPRAALARSAAPKGGAALYLHGFGYGEWLWHFTVVPGYDYALAQARAGHVSVVIDRLGYGASGHPSGNETCLGAAADIAHQVVSKLRSGDYSAGGGPGPSFKRIALVGHSMGAEIANIEAASFGDVDALVIVSHSFTNLPLAQVLWGVSRQVCDRGGEPASAGGPGGYAFFAQTAGEFQADELNDAVSAVGEAAARLHGRDPCGDSGSVIPAILLQRQTLPRIAVPVLVICGKRDLLYAGFGCEFQRDRYTKARDRSLALVPGAGHAITLGRAAPTFRAKLGRWLGRHGF